MAAITAFRVTQHSQIFPLFFRNRIQCIALYQLYNSQALLNLRRGYYSSNLVDRKLKCYFIIIFSLLFSIRLCWREIRPDAGKTTEHEFVASFL